MEDKLRIKDLEEKFGKIKPLDEQLKDGDMDLEDIENFLKGWHGDDMKEIENTDLPIDGTIEFRDEDENLNI